MRSGGVKISAPVLKLKSDCFDILLGELVGRKELSNGTCAVRPSNELNGNHMVVTKEADRSWGFHHQNPIQLIYGVCGEIGTMLTH